MQFARCVRAATSHLMPTVMPTRPGERSDEVILLMGESGELGLLMAPGETGTWISRRPYLWQMGFLDAGDFARLTGTFGFGMPFDRRAIEQLWQLGLLRADVVEGPADLGVPELVQRGERSEDRCLYSDERQARVPDGGFVGAADHLPDLDENLRPLFHPFRSLVLHYLDGLLEPWVSPMQHLHAKDSFPAAAVLSLERFQHWSSSKSFIDTIERWNGLAALAVAIEPCFYQRLFGGWLTIPSELIVFDGTETNLDARRDAAFARLLREIEEHWTSNVAPLVTAIGLDRMEEGRQELCIACERCDSNKDVHIMLRLERGKSRLDLKGRLGAAVYLNTMAEMLRRASERAFDTKLPEEDERGFGLTFPEAKKRLYGSDRLLDGDAEVAAAFIREQGVDYRPSLRWYVEGATEYFAILDIVEAFRATHRIGLINLSGQFIEKRHLVFRQNLRSDMAQQIFSYVSLDKGQSKTERDNVRLVKRAARDGDMFGRFFVSDPDFEFGNFELSELEEMLWSIAVAKRAQYLVDVDQEGQSRGHDGTGLPADADAAAQRVALHAAIAQAANGEELISKACSALVVLSRLSKGEEWGRSLMRYAWEHKGWKGNQLRPIIAAVESALRISNQSFTIARDGYYTDPEQGTLVEKPRS